MLDPPARHADHAHRLCHRAHGCAIRKAFTAGPGRGLSARGAARGDAPGDSGRRTHSRFPHHPASDPPEEVRGRRALVEAAARRVHVYRWSLRRAWKRLLTKYRRGPVAIKAKPTVRALMEP